MEVAAGEPTIGAAALNIARALWRVLGWSKSADVAYAIVAMAKKRRKGHGTETPPLIAAWTTWLPTPAWKWNWAWRKAVSKGIKLSSLKLNLLVQLTNALTLGDFSRQQVAPIHAAPDAWAARVALGVDHAFDLDAAHRVRPVLRYEANLRLARVNAAADRSISRFSVVRNP